MCGLKLDPGHAMVPVDCAPRKSRGTVFPGIQGCGQVSRCLLGQGGDGLVIKLSRTTPQQDPSYVQSEQKIPCTKLEGCWPQLPHELITPGQTAIITLIPVLGLVMAGQLHPRCRLCTPGGTARTAVWRRL